VKQRYQDPPKRWYPTTSHYTTSQSRRPRLESSLPWKPQIWHSDNIFNDIYL